ncbi:MAG TPA: hypothetical protein VMJ10_29685, partial [Kofleriaceae bacterium]|nr:hypothetical protein [Kofleriaceae bacterium]
MSRRSRRGIGRATAALVASLAVGCHGSSGERGDAGAPDGPGVVTPADQSEIWLANATVDAQGRIVAVGAIARDGATDIAVLRFLSTGAADATFGTAGLVRLDLGSPLDVGYGVRVDPQGHILIAGETSRDGTPDVAIVRLGSDGSLDPAFASAGVAVFALSTFGNK